MAEVDTITFVDFEVRVRISSEPVTEQDTGELRDYLQAGIDWGLRRFRRLSGHDAELFDGPFVMIDYDQRLIEDEPEVA